MALEDELREELEQAFNVATNSVRLNTPKPHVLWWPNGHPTFIAVPEDRSYGHKEAQRDGQIVADFTLAGDKWAALFALVIKRMPTILAALTERKAPVEVEGLVAEAKRYQEHILTPDHYHGASALVGQLADALQSQATELATLADFGERASSELSKLYAERGRLATELATLKQQLAEREEAIKQALACTPSVRDGAIIYDCGNPWDILRARTDGGDQ